jgi:hypothetical protein
VCKVEVSEDASGNLEAAGNPDGFDGKERVEKDAAKGTVGGVSHPEAPIGYEVAGQANSGGSRVGRRNRMRRWLLPGAAALVVSFVAATWCFRHPLPRRVSGHTQKTDFADGASVPGLGFAGTGLHSVFSPDGKELYYLLRKETRMSGLHRSTATHPRSSSPQLPRGINNEDSTAFALLIGSGRGRRCSTSFDATRNGRRLVLDCDAHRSVYLNL